jgi:hypothetical protein
LDTNGVDAAPVAGLAVAAGVVAALAVTALRPVSVAPMTPPTSIEPAMAPAAMVARILLISVTSFLVVAAPATLGPMVRTATGRGLRGGCEVTGKDLDM